MRQQMLHVPEPGPGRRLWTLLLALVFTQGGENEVSSTQMPRVPQNAP